MKGLILILILIGTINLQAASKIPIDPKKIKIMAYNVENLFDWSDDAGKNDETYLPLSQKRTKAHVALCNKNTDIPVYIKQCLTLDWSEAVVKEKIHRVANTITQLSPQGPDILILEEVENQNVLTLLNQELKGSHYQTQILIEGQDSRGIDVAILSRFPIAKQQLHLLPTTKILTRGILQADLILPSGETITVFGLHQPSQANPVEFRQMSIDLLNELMLSLPKDRFAMAGGDFNISHTEEKKQQFFAGQLEENWDVSHLHSTVPALGTHFYQKKWDFLDAILIKDMSRSTNQRFTPKWGTFRPLTNGVYQLNDDGTPARFDSALDIGVSDHLPIYGEIALTAAAPAKN